MIDRRISVLSLVLAVLSLSFLTAANPAAPTANDLRISQVYGGGGNSGAFYTNDFIEIFNAGASTIDLTGYSVQYASATGTSWQVTLLSGSIDPGQYYLIQEAAGSGGTNPLPPPDATGTIAMSATSGKVALVGSATALSGSCPGGWLDVVGYGTADCFEGGAAAPVLTNTSADLRALNGCQDTDVNSADFSTISPPNPRNTASPTNSCAVDNPPTVVSTSPADSDVGVALDTNVTVEFSEAVTLDTNWYTFDCTNTGSHLGIPSGGPVTYTLDPFVDMAFDDVCTFTVVANQVADQDGTPNNMAQDYVFTFTAVSNDPPALVVNEVDYDQASTDSAEFVEIKNTGVISASLNGVTLELVNGTGGGATVYATYSLPDVTLAAGGYFVVCANAANTPNCDLDVLPDTNMVQNGDPDAVALKLGSVLLDTLSYGGNTGAPYTEGSGVGLDDDPAFTGFGLSRCADGVDTNQNNVDFLFAAISPGKKNCLPTLVINEIDYDQPSTDAAEFVEIKNTGSVSVNLLDVSLVLVNGSGSSVYDTIVLPDVDLAAGDYYVVCANAANTPNCDLDDTPDTNWVQNGSPDAVALYSAAADLLDVVSYEGDTVGYTEGSGTGLVDDGTAALESIGRCEDGTDTNQNNVDFVLAAGTPGAANDCAPATACLGTPTLISAVQGNSSASPIVGSTVEVAGIVVGDYQGSTGLNGFFVQEEDAENDADPLSSEGLFIFDSSFGIDVAVGDLVQVGGTVTEFFTLTEINAITCLTVVSSANALPTAAAPLLPVTALTDLEPFEGMLVTFNQELTATENFTLGRYGEVTLSAGGRLWSPTQVALPGAPALAVADLNARSQIQLDDGSNIQNPLPLPPYLAADNTLRAGDTIPSLTGVLSYAFGVYEVHPVGPISFTRANDRTAAPDPVGGTLNVAAFNVLNYFTTIDTGLAICGPLGNLDCRGADSLAEFTRQRDKIFAALLAIDADIVGLMEIENDAANVAVADLVSGLNAIAGAGTYDYIATGPIGTDAIRVALIYKPAAVTPQGSFAILDSSVDPTFLDTKNRPSLAQTFMENATGELFTVAVNHLKSKGSDCNDVGDPDTGDGQGNCNLTRLAAATALANWLATDPTGSGDPDSLIIGDLNSYALEDPIAALESLGYTNLIGEAYGPTGYSYVFFGAAGTLDYALANPSLHAQVSGATSWHDNADEPSALDYNDYNQPLLYNPDPYRASDHDPVIVGLALGPELALSMDDGGVTITFGTTVAYTLGYTNTGTVTATSVVLTATVPAGAVYDASESSGWSCSNGSLPGTDCTYSAGSLAPGASGSVVFAVRPPASQGGAPFDINASAEIGDAEGDSATAGDTTPVENAVVHIQQILMIDRSTARAYVVNMVFHVVNQFGVGVDGIRLQAEITEQPDGRTGIYIQRTGHGGFTSTFSRAVNPGTFTVCALNIFGPGVTYDSGSNIETCDSLTLPVLGPALILPGWIE